MKIYLIHLQQNLHNIKTSKKKDTKWEINR